MVNLSIRGCKINSTTAVAEGANLGLEFEVADGEPRVKVDGAVVRYALHHFLGLEFFKIQTEEEGRISRIIANRLQARPPMMD